jgi:hypothetical protein
MKLNSMVTFRTEQLRHILLLDTNEFVVWENQGERWDFFEGKALVVVVVVAVDRHVCTLLCEISS